MKKSLVFTILLVLILSNLSFAIAQTSGMAAKSPGFWGKIMGFFSGLGSKLFGGNKVAKTVDSSAKTSSAVNPTSTEAKPLILTPSTSESSNIPTDNLCEKDYHETIAMCMDKCQSMVDYCNQHCGPKCNEWGCSEPGAVTPCSDCTDRYNTCSIFCSGGCHVM